MRMTTPYISKGGWKYLWISILSLSVYALDRRHLASLSVGKNLHIIIPFKVYNVYLLHVFQWKRIE